MPCIPIDLWKLNEDIPRTAPHNEVEITPQNEPLKFTIPPNDVMDDGVTYTTVLQSEVRTYCIKEQELTWYPDRH